MYFKQNFDGLSLISLYMLISETVNSSNNVITRRQSYAVWSVDVLVKGRLSFEFGQNGKWPIREGHIGNIKKSYRRCQETFSRGRRIGQIFAVSLYLFVYLFIHLFVHLFAPSTHSLAHTTTHPPIHQLTHLPTRSLAHSLTHSLIYLFICLFIMFIDYIVLLLFICSSQCCVKYSKGGKVKQNKHWKGNSFKPFP